MKRTLVSLAAGCIPLALAWLGGFDFDVRGQTMFDSGIFSLFCVGACYFCPNWSSE